MRWNIDELQQFVDKWLPLLSEGQRAVYDHVMDVMEGRVEAGPIFVDGPSGTGKTLLFNVISAKVRCLAKIVLNASATGISALNYPGGMTAHALFKLPLDTSDPNSYCDISAATQRGKLIMAADVIIWDEAPMSHRHNVETVERTLEDLTGKKKFGGKLSIHGGDKRQIPPVVKNGGKRDVLNASLKFSPFWKEVKVFSLNAPQRDKEDRGYSEFVLKVGEDRIESMEVTDGERIEKLIPLELVERVQTVDELIDFVYEDITNEEECAKKAILSGTNRNIDQLNKEVLKRLPGEEFELLSADHCVLDNNSPDEKFLPNDILHKISEPGIPEHCINVKKGTICIITRNLSFADGLVNGSKVIIRNASNRIVQADLLRDGFPPKRVSIPRINFTFTPRNSTATICRRQFPLRVAYCLTFNKSQGQTLDRVGLDLRSDVFAHGQLYVALGRVRNRASIRVLVPEHRVHGNTALTANIVYPELL